MFGVLVRKCFKLSVTQVFCFRRQGQVEALAASGSRLRTTTVDCELLQYPRLLPQHQHRRKSDSPQRPACSGRCTGARVTSNVTRAPPRHGIISRNSAATDAESDGNKSPESATARCSVFAVCRSAYMLADESLSRASGRR